MPCPLPRPDWGPTALYALPLFAVGIGAVELCAKNIGLIGDSIQQPT